MLAGRAEAPSLRRWPGWEWAPRAGGRVPDGAPTVCHSREQRAGHGHRQTGRRVVRAGTVFCFTFQLDHVFLHVEITPNTWGPTSGH